jgi:hypothetical protein
MNIRRVMFITAKPVTSSRWSSSDAKCPEEPAVNPIILVVAPQSIYIMMDMLVLSNSHLSTLDELDGHAISVLGTKVKQHS